MSNKKMKKKKNQSNHCTNTLAGADASSPMQTVLCPPPATPLPLSAVGGGARAPQDWAAGLRGHLQRRSWVLCSAWL